MSERTETGLPRVLAIAWGTDTAPARGPARGLSHERIVEAAVEIADRDGLAGVTMARVAEAVGFTTMSLYRYVTNKDELLMLMQGSVAALPGSPPGDDTDWRAGLRGWVEGLRDGYRRHPWLLDVRRSPTAVLMPASTAMVDAALGVMRDLRLDDQERIAVILSLSTYASSFVALERDLSSAEVPELGPDAMAELGSVITPEQFPHLAPLMLAGGYVGGPDSGLDASPEEMVGFDFWFGLDRILDGLAVLHERRARGDGAAPEDG